MNLLHKLGFFADEYLRKEISKLKGARRIDAETIAQLEAENERAAAIIARQVETIRKADERFKKAVGDLAEQADEIARMGRGLRMAGEVSAGLRDSLETWKGVAKENARDARKWRDYLKRSRDRKEAKKRVAKPLVPASPPESSQVQP